MSEEQKNAITAEQIGKALAEILPAFQTITGREFQQIADRLNSLTDRLNSLTDRSKAQPATEAGGEWEEFMGAEGNTKNYKRTPLDELRDPNKIGDKWEKAAYENSNRPFVASYLYRRPRIAPAPATPARFSDCPRTTAVLRRGSTCKPDHLYVTADSSDILERELNAAQAALLAEQKAHGIAKDNLGTSRSNVIKEMNRANELQNELTTARSEVERLREELKDEKHDAKERFAYYRAELAKLSWRPVSPETMPTREDGRPYKGYTCAVKWANHEQEWVTRWDDGEQFSEFVPTHWKHIDLPTPAVDDGFTSAAAKLMDLWHPNKDPLLFAQEVWQAARAQEGKA